MRTTPFLLAVLLVMAGLGGARAESSVVLTIPSTPAAPRNSEGAFVTLKSGRILFYFSQFSGGSSDFDRNHISEVHSDDQGATWSSPDVVLSPPPKSLSLMDLCLLRLADGRIALVYGQKDSFLESHPYIRFSSDEANTWSEPVRITAGPGYYTINNDRMIQTESGRLILPVGFDRSRSLKNDISSLDERSTLLWFLSDDGGRTWRESESMWSCPVPSKNGLQEPGVVELSGGALFCWSRSDAGCQFGCTSVDHGQTWSPPAPTEMKTPLSPASIKRVPGSSALLAVYNDHSGKYPYPTDGGISRHRTPLVVSLSLDNGLNWPVREVLESDPHGEYAYTAIHFDADSVFLAYSFNPLHGPHLGSLRIRRIRIGREGGRPVLRP